MNINLPFLPDRSEKPRKTGLAMVMDTGLSIRQLEDVIDTSGELIDFLKFGFGTSVISKNIKEKIKLCQENNIKAYPGGTLFEAFIVRGMFNEYQKLLDELKVQAVEVSNGSTFIEHSIKCEYITKLAKDFTVLSEIGSKDPIIKYSHDEWISQMETELIAGSFKVIAEAHESGTFGIYDTEGEANVSLINSISQKINLGKIIWETPKKNQQVWFVKHFGTNVNLGNISPSDLISLETLRLGLRSDTFQQFLPE